MQKAAPLIPALKSNWLIMHVSVMILSYATLILGSLLCVAFVVLSFILYKNCNAETGIPSFMQFEVGTISLFEKAENNELVKIVNSLDNLSYRFIGISFPLLTLGIISGAVWANETWGSYWSWDPKETWALITWLVFSIYLHLRIFLNKKGVMPALVGSAGFVVVWICYLGVNLLGKGLHSYGWFS
jgi:cytochrome c-type biogenesis protein CcsB